MLAKQTLQWVSSHLQNLTLYPDLPGFDTAARRSWHKERLRLCERLTALHNKIPKLIYDSGSLSAIVKDKKSLYKLAGRVRLDHQLFDRTCSEKWLLRTGITTIETFLFPIPKK